jgi:hypothetical protein
MMNCEVPLPFKGFWKNLALYGFTLGLIGPVLSFFTLQSQAGYGTERALLYAVVSFIADLLSILVFSKVYSRFAGGFEKAGREALLAYLPMWLLDIFDIYQPLRFLSNLGFVISLIFLYRCVREKGISFKVISALLSLWAVLYLLDGIISEAVALSPLGKELLKNFSNQTG